MGKISAEQSSFLSSQFDGFEEVSLPDVEEEDEPPKMHAASKNKKRKEMGGQSNDKVSWPLSEPALERRSTAPKDVKERIEAIPLRFWSSRGVRRVLGLPRPPVSFSGHRNVLFAGGRVGGRAEGKFVFVPRRERRPQAEEEQAPELRPLRRQGGSGWAPK